MTIEFHCPDCGKLLRTSDDKAGRSANCPGCGATITVPGTASSPSEGSSQAYPGTSVPPFAAGGSSDLNRPVSASGADSAYGEAMKACPVCGEQIRAAAVRCRYCGEEIGGRPIQPATEGYLKPHRGVMLLVFSILSWTLQCPLFGIVAFVMANQDLKEMSAGIMDPTGEGLTKAAKIISLVHLILLAIALVGGCIIWFFVVVAQNV